MKKIAACLLLLVMVFNTNMQATKRYATELKRLLCDMVEETTTHPDSLYAHIVRMEQRCAACNDATEQALTHAVLGKLYYEGATSSSSFMYAEAMRTGNLSAQASNASAQKDSLVKIMKGWSRDDFYQASARHYREAFQQKELLHAARISNWAPLLERGKHDKHYANDMLMVVHRASKHLLHTYRNDMPSDADLRDFYLAKGQREAALLLSLSSGNYHTKDSLEALRQRYQDLDLCAEVYLRLANSATDDSLSVALLREALKRYPNYLQKAEIEQRLDEILLPELRVYMGTPRPYPGHRYKWSIHAQHVDKMCINVYRLNEDFDPEAYKKIDFEKTKQCLSYIRKHAKLIESIDHPFALHHPWEAFHDTIEWTAPAPGKYVATMLPTTRMKLNKKVNTHISFFDATRLLPTTISLPNGAKRIYVNDAMTGAPLANTNVTLYTIQQEDTTTEARLTTNEEGFVDWRWPIVDRKGNRWADDGTAPIDNQTLHNYEWNFLRGVYLQLDKDDDRSCPATALSYDGMTYDAASDRSQYIHVYTDRSIYRPGQTLHIGGLIYNRHQWEEQTKKGLAVDIKVLNANYKNVATETVKTDSLGVFTVDFELPSTGLTGLFHIMVNNTERASFRVEEYKRPTFEVTCDEAPALQMPADSITLTGRAMNYNGVPVRGGSVVAKQLWREGYFWWWTRTLGEHEVVVDTVMTDNEGCFSVRVPINRTAAQLRYGNMLCMTYDVTSPTGETHSAQMSCFICSRPLSLYAEIPDKVDRDKLESWTLNLVSSTGKPVDADIHLALMRNEKVIFEAKERSGRNVVPTSMKDAPSGRYLMKLTAIAHGDTATYQTHVTVFSQHDSHVPDESVLWCYTPEDHFSADKAARIQLGSHTDAWLYYTITSNREVVAERLIHVHDSLFTIDIPYEARFEQGLKMNALIVKEEQRYEAEQVIYLKTPEKQLKHKWITFRDRLLPGQTETWQLQLSKPDGTPAAANLMASLYDASLDAIYGHDWTFDHHFLHHIFQPRWGNLLSSTNLLLSNYFETKEYKERAFSYSNFDNKLFSRITYGSYLASKQRRSSTNRGDLIGGGAMPMYAVMREPMLSKANAQSMNDTMEESATAEGNNSDTESLNNGSNAADPAIPLRENFSETAFFLPMLRTDEEGRVSIEFTLPESLTTWRLLGMAHTQDMFTTLLDEKAVAQKDLMAQTSLPRFLRQGDQAQLSAAIYNISATSQRGRAVMTILDASSEKILLKQALDFDVCANSDTTLWVPFIVPDDASMLIVRWVAEGSNCSDGEQRYLPVLSNKQWTLDTHVLTYTQPGSYTEPLDQLFQVKGATNRQLTIEYTSQPLWFAVQALPALAWPKSIDVLSLATAYYSGSMASLLAKQNPRLRTALNDLRTEGVAQKSKLLENEELKNIVLEETPWIAEAEKETERIERLASLFDPATQESLQKTYMDKMLQLQNTDGGFAWYPDMQSSYYLTREVAYLLVRLKKMGGENHNQILNRAIDFIRKDRPTWLGTSSLRYLYVLYQGQVTLNKDDKHNADSLCRQIRKHPEHFGIEDRALAAIVMQKAGYEKDAMKYLESVKDYLVTNQEGLTYFEFPQGNFYSVDRKLHIHVQVMEALAELTPDDPRLEGMRRWLLRQKRTTEWGTPVNTANAVYALLLNNKSIAEVAGDQLSLTTRKGKLTLPTETASLGYARQHYTLDKTGNVSKLTINKKGSGESWGGIYAQYLAPIQNLTATNKGDLLVEQQWSNVSTQQAPLQTACVGDRLHVRYIITAERDFEYVCLHAPRSAACEPDEQLSGYVWNHGVGYYRAVKDASTEFFFDRLPRGTHIIEEDVLVERPGHYTTGAVTIQCLYAPEFSAHSADAPLVVKK